MLTLLGAPDVFSVVRIKLRDLAVFGSRLHVIDVIANYLLRLGIVNHHTLRTN